MDTIYFSNKTSFAFDTRRYFIDSYSCAIHVGARLGPCVIHGKMIKSFIHVCTGERALLSHKRFLHGKIIRNSHSYVPKWDISFKTYMLKRVEFKNRVKCARIQGHLLSMHHVHSYTIICTILYTRTRLPALKCKKYMFQTLRKWKILSVDLP